MFSSAIYREGFVGLGFVLIMEGCVTTRTGRMDLTTSGSHGGNGTHEKEFSKDSFSVQETSSLGMERI